MIALLAMIAAADPRALELVEQAARAREAGKLEQSLAFMREAYAIDPQPLLLNNVGAILEQLGRYAQAVETFEKVLASKDIPPELRELDEERVARLRPKLKSAYVFLEAKTNPKLVLLMKGTTAANVEVAFAEPRPVELVAVYDRRQKSASFRFIELHLGSRATIPELLPQPRNRQTIVFDPPNAKRIVIDGDVFDFDQGLASAEVDGVFYEMQTSWDPGSTPFVWEGQPRTGMVIARPKEPAPRAELDPAIDPTTTPVSEPPPEAPVWPWISAGGGAIAAGIAVALFAGAANDVAMVNDRAGTNGVVLGLDRARAEELDASAANKGRWGVVLSITGAVAIAAGIGGLVF